MLYTIITLVLVAGFICWFRSNVDNIFKWIFYILLSPLWIPYLLFGIIVNLCYKAKNRKQKENLICK